MNEENAPPCPKCGSKETVPVMYGLPAPDFDYDANDVVLGGCCITPVSPRWACRNCETTWGVLEDMDFGMDSAERPTDD